MKILLNSLPPADIKTPSISLSILKSFLYKNNIKSEIKYWNFDLSLMSEYIDSEDTEIRLLPFLSILNDRDGNIKGNNRIISLLQKLQPSFKTYGNAYYSELLQDKKDEIYKIIKKEIAKIDFSQISLFGITAKYNQWISGMIVAEEIKKVAPDVKIIVGGFGSANSANQAMKFCKHFDFANWGEGEYPLLELSIQLINENINYNNVPRLMYRMGEEIIKSSTNKSEYLDFANYIYPNYDDYIDSYPSEEETDNINIPINSIRSCNWGRCKFCDFNKGYKLRQRTPECVVSEIEHITNKYGFTTFSFVDSDTFISLEHFEKLVDLIIDLKYRTEKDFIFWSEIIPNSEFSAKLMQKMAIAGFKNIFIGYDALCDSLLSKMNKRNSFSDNIFFVKHSIKNGISPFVNVIKHVPGETESDIQESINNLHFLRFFYNNSVVSFSHNYVNLVLSSMTKYYSAMSQKERNNYNIDELSYLIPDYFSDNEDKFHLFRYEKNVKSNLSEWENLIEIEEYYKKNKFSYNIQENNGIVYYTEYCNDTEIENIMFGEPEYAIIIEILQEKIFSFPDLFDCIKKQRPQIAETMLKQILTNLKETYLIYFKPDFTNIVSVIEF